ncbi:MAG: hypothetical protein WA919_29195 [Coleofasciculaceae cyanobacterium]
MAVLATLYLLVAIWFFVDWLQAFQKDTYLSPEEKSFSLKLLVLATIFWPVVAPISFASKLINPSTKSRRTTTSSRNKSIQPINRELAMYQRYFY